MNALGLWQLKRGDWKNDVIGRFEQALSKPPVPYEPPPANADEQQREFLRVTVTGAIDGADAVKQLVPAPEQVRALTQDAFGYLLFTPLKTGETTVLVNQGFVPRTLAGDAARPARQATVTGILRLSRPTNWITPAPDLAQRLFYSADIPEMTKAAGLSGASVVTSEYVEAEPSRDGEAWPKPRDPRELLASISNRHLEHALIWIGLAAALAIVYGVFILRR